MNTGSMIGDKILQFKRLLSTNNYVAKELEDGQYDFGTVILAHFQSKGKGQRDSDWQSASGENLTFSFAVSLEGFDTRTYFLLSMALSLGLTAMLREIITSRKVYIKWPNDILLGSKKVAGILIETGKGAERHAICGIGLNVNQVQFENLPDATSMALESGGKFDRLKVLNRFLFFFNKEWRELNSGDFRTLHDRYCNELFGLGQKVFLEDDGLKNEAIIEDVSVDGRLVLNVNGKRRKILPKTVRLKY